MTTKDIKETQVGSEKVYDGRILSLSVDKVALPNGKQSTREVIEHNGGVTIVAQTEPEKVVMVKQYRYPVKKALWELPAGRLEDGEDPVLGAKRELQEETGFIPKKMDSLGIVYPAPGYSSEVLYFFKATDLEDGEPNPDVDENLEVKIFDIKQVWQMVKDGEIRDAKTIAGLTLVMH